MVLLGDMGAVALRRDWLKANWLRLAVHAGALLPLTLLLWDYAQGAFLIDPVREITTRTGKTAIILLILTLACTPINTVFGFRQVLRVRRTLGLYTFLYVGLHFLTFIWLDYGLDFALILQAVFDQRYVLVGFAAGLILLLLALTSTKGWQGRLGKKWKRLHQLVYVAGVLAVIHYLWLLKDIRDPLRYGILVALLLLLRIPQVRRAVSRLRHRLRTRLEVGKDSDRPASQPRKAAPKSRSRTADRYPPDLFP